MGSQGQLQYAMVKAVEEAFDQLVLITKKACEVYAKEQNEAWALHSTRPDARWLEDVLLDFWYADSQDGRSTRPYIGMIAAGPELIRAVTCVNEAKNSFQTQLRELKELDSKIYAPIKGSLMHRHPHVHRNIAGAGLARLNLKQSWRRIPVLDKEPKRVHFSWYQHGRSIKKLSVLEAEKQLVAIGSEKPHIQIQLALLAGLPSSEPLAQIQAQAPLMRANAFFDDVVERSALNVSLPLFVPSKSGNLPMHNEPPEAPHLQRTRTPRRDRKIEDEPFLRSIRVHRYMAPNE